MLANLGALVTGDHEALRAVAGVRSAGTPVQEHCVYSKCRATKEDILDGDAFAEWKEEMHPTDLLPDVPVY